MVLLTNKILGSFESPPQGTTTVLHHSNGNSDNISTGSDDPTSGRAPLLHKQASYSNVVRTNNVTPRSEISLFNESGKPHTFKTGTVPHSVFYALPKTHSQLQLCLLSAIRDSFTRDQGLGLLESESPSHLIFEVVLRTATDCSPALTNPVTFTFEGTNHTFPAFAAVSSESGLRKVNFTEVPCLGYDVLKTQLLSTFSSFGTVRDIVVYEDDISGSWFRGSGHVYIERPQTSELPDLTHRMIFTDNPAHKFLATWSKMGTHCRFCKALGHRKESCPNRPSETRQCFTCGQKGHIAIHCPREAISATIAPTGAKRSRHDRKKKTAVPPPPRSPSPSFTHGSKGSNASIYASPKAANARRSSTPLSLGEFFPSEPKMSTQTDITDNEDVLPPIVFQREIIILK